jgi:two-component system response regulator RegA
LVVEDDRTSREALRRLFQARGWEVSTAETLAEGLTLLEPPPDCLLLDLMLPDGPGEVLLEKIRTEGLPTKVAIYSGVVEHERLEAVRRMSPHVLLEKPVDLHDIFAACDE